MKPLHLLIKPASGNCNLRCHYCFYYDLTRKRKIENYGIMTEQTLENVIRKALSFAEGECTIAYQGGEPTLAGLDFFKKSIEFQLKYNQKNIPIYNTLQTNGYGLGEEWGEFFSDNKFLIGLSLDGLQDTHNAFRRNKSEEGTYQDIIKAACLLEKCGVDFNILTVLNSKTVKKPRKIYQNYQKKGFSYQQYIACLDPLGEEPGKREYSLLPEEYGKFLCELFDCWYEDLLVGKQPYIRTFENYINILLGNAPESCEQRGICGIQNVIEADGEVYPCDFYVTDEYSLGNLNEVDFIDLYKKREELLFIQNSNNHVEECRQCRFFPLCRGGCNRNRVYKSQSGSRNYFCAAYQMFFEYTIYRMEQIAERIRHVQQSERNRGMYE